MAKKVVSQAKKPTAKKTSLSKSKKPTKKTTTTPAYKKKSQEIQKALEGFNAYSPAFDILIDTCSQLCHLRSEAFKEIGKEGIVVEEMSREGNMRKRSNPAFNVYLEAVKELRMVLGELLMTVKSANFSEGDEFDKLTDELSKVVKGEG